MTDDEKAVKAEASKAALLAAYRRLKPREQRAFFAAFKRSAGGEPLLCRVPRRMRRSARKSDRGRSARVQQRRYRLGCCAIALTAMISELDIWRAANLLIRKHGADAELEAAKHADLMLDRGDDEGRLLWARIKRAIEALQAPPSGQTRAGSGELSV